MTTIVTRNNKQAIFEIALEDKVVYMSIECTRSMNEKRFVVIVDSKKFLKLWQNEPHPLDKNLNFGNESLWKNDYKFQDAEQGFSFGLINPVPLADIVCYTNKTNKLPYIAINNGVTRTIWLLSNKAKSFPIECHSLEEAQMLVEFAATQNNELHSVQSLLNCS